MPLNPALKIHSREAAIIGRILMAFGELEYIICKSVAECRDKPFPILRALYRISGTTPRIEAADALAREIYTDLGMGAAFADAIGALKICMRIRHQYAHCAWADGGKGRNGGLYFVDLSASAEASSGWVHNWRHVNISLLKQQYDYFEYTKDLLFHIETGATAWRRSQLPLFPKPSKRVPPRPHNPPDRQSPSGWGKRINSVIWKPLGQQKRPSVHNNAHARVRNRLLNHDCPLDRCARRRCERRCGSAAHSLRNHSVSMYVEFALPH